jgi:uncharacterized protein (TIGR03118 family)
MKIKQDFRVQSFSAFGFLLGLSQLLPQSAMAGSFAQLNLVSDLPGVARHTDPNLVNPWGIVTSKNGSIQVANNGTGTSTAYFGNGDSFPNGTTPLVISIPGPGGVGSGKPTGLVLNKTNGFVIRKGNVSAPATYLFATEDGTIAGWNKSVDPTHAIIVIDNSASKAIYKGLAIGSSHGRDFIYATNFHDNRVEMYDRNFRLVKVFTDPNVPSDFAPFGIRKIHGKLYVTFAKQDADKEDDVPGQGNGFVDVFSTNGDFIERLISRGELNSPWGLALAPEGFGKFEFALLVGNFGNGRINAFDIESGKFLGTLRDFDANPLVIEGLWALTFGNGTDDQSRTSLFFAAGIDDENHGLFGKIRFCHKDEDQKTCQNLK